MIAWVRALHTPLKNSKFIRTGWGLLALSWSISFSKKQRSGYHTSGGDVTWSGWLVLVGGKTQ